MLKFQLIVVTFTYIAKYITIFFVIKKATWLRFLLNEIILKIHSNSYVKLRIILNSQSAIFLVKNSVYYNCIKHINIVYHYIQKKITIERIELEYI